MRKKIKKNKKRINRKEKNNLLLKKKIKIKENLIKLNLYY